MFVTPVESDGHVFVQIPGIVPMAISESSECQPRPDDHTELVRSLSPFELHDWTLAV